MTAALAKQRRSSLGAVDDDARRVTTGRPKRGDFRYFHKVHLLEPRKDDDEEQKSLLKGIKEQLTLISSQVNAEIPKTSKTEAMQRGPTLYGAPQQ